MAFRKILIATDFSAAADRALEYGVGLARQLGATVHVVHAYDLPIPTVHPYQVAVPDPFLRACWREAHKRLDETVAKVRAEGVEADSKLSEVPAAEAIAHEAEESGCDVIVMATRGNRGLKRMLLGSVAEHTVRLANCPVITVNPPHD